MPEALKIILWTLSICWSVVWNICCWLLKGLKLKATPSNPVLRYMKNQSTLHEFSFSYVDGLLLSTVHVFKGNTWLTEKTLNWLKTEHHSSNLVALFLLTTIKKSWYSIDRITWSNLSWLKLTIRPHIPSFIRRLLSWYGYQIPVQAVCLKFCNSLRLRKIISNKTHRCG